jgi:hypothetical protein
MKKSMAVLCAVLCLGLIMIAGCANTNAGQVQVAPTVSIPADIPDLPGTVIWARGAAPYDGSIGSTGEWSLQVENQAQWDQLASDYKLTLDGDTKLDFSKYVILVLFYADHQGSEYELTELALIDGMATIGIHEKTQGATEGQQLVACIVELDEKPLEINSYRDEDAVG